MAGWAAVSAERITKSGSSENSRSRFGSEWLPRFATPPCARAPGASTASSVVPASAPPASSQISP